MVVQVAIERIEEPRPRRRYACEDAVYHDEGSLLVRPQCLGAWKAAWDGSNDGF